MLPVTKIVDQNVEWSGLNINELVTVDNEDIDYDDMDDLDSLSSSKSDDNGIRVNCRH